MWSQLEQRKNHFLQMQLPHLKAQEINKMVNKELKENLNKRNFCNKISLPDGNCQSSLYFKERAALAYGFWALPKLMKELNSDIHVIQSKAINSLAEYIVNPLNAQRAITLVGIVRRCQNVFLRIRMKYRQVKYHETNRLLIIFYYIAMHRNGAEQILQKNRLLDQFYGIISDQEIYLEATVKILPHLSEDPKNCLYLINEYKVFDKLWIIWNQDPCKSYYPTDLWLHLTHILELAPQEAVVRGFFEIFYKRIQGRLLNYHVWDMKCFALLLRCHEGQQRFVQVDGLKLLYTILNESYLDDFENVVFALMHGLFTKSILWRCREFTKLPLIVTKLAKDSNKSQQQLYCLQALREMGVMPVIKRFIKENCLQDLRQLECKTCSSERERREIIYWLEREIYHTSNLKAESFLPNPIAN